jgi:hypothetical protein
MAIIIELEGRSFEAAPFKLGDLERVAPFVDQMNALNRELDEAEKAGEDLRLERVTALLRAQTGILANALGKIDPEMTADKIFSMVDLTFVRSLGQAVGALLRSSGLQSAGEARAHSGQARPGMGSESKSAE